jgi:hypothetical protein
MTCVLGADPCVRVDRLLGKEIRVLGDGEFDAPVTLPLPLGSVLVLHSNPKASPRPNLTLT